MSILNKISHFEGICFTKLILGPWRCSFFWHFFSWDYCVQIGIFFQRHQECMEIRSFRKIYKKYYFQSTGGVFYFSYFNFDIFILKSEFQKNYARVLSKISFFQIIKKKINQNLKSNGGVFFLGFYGSNMNFIDNRYFDNLANVTWIIILLVKICINECLIYFKIKEWWSGQSWNREQTNSLSKKYFF